MALRHFHEQEAYTEQYLVPYLKKYTEWFNGNGVKPKVLDVGCAEGGTISHLLKVGCECDGVEISSSRARIAQDRLPESAKVLVADITHDVGGILSGPYDIIILRDVIEHIPRKALALSNLRDLLTDRGYLFVAFPLKYSPFAGHQQIAGTWIKYFAYISLLPKSLIKAACRLAGEREVVRDSILENKQNALSYRQFRNLIGVDWSIARLDFFLSRPIYRQRFGWPTRRMANIPGLRELVNGCEVLLQKSN